MPDKQFRLVIDLDARKVKRGAAQTESALNRIDKKIRQVSSVAVAAGAAMAAMFIRSSIQKAIEQETVMRRVESVVRATGGAAGLSARQIADYAAELQRATAIGDEAILKTAAVLLSFKQIQGDVFKETLSLAADVSEVMQTDMTTSALMLAKALADPVSRLGELSRSGIIFTQVQKDMVKELVESNKLFEAQRLILEEIRSQYGGAAAEVRNTLGGALRAFRSEFGDLQEMLILESGSGGALRTAVEAWVRWIQEVKKHWGDLRAAFNITVAWILEGIANIIRAMARFVNAFRWLPGVTKDHVRSMRSIAKTIDLMADAFQERAIAAVGEFNTRMKQLAPNLDVMSASAEKSTDKLEELLAVIERILTRLESRNVKEILSRFADVGGIQELPGGSFSGQMIAELKESQLYLEKMPSDFGKQLGEAVTDALTQALASGDVKNARDAFANALAAGVNQAVSTAVTNALIAQGASAGAAAGPIGAIVGAIAGGLIGKFFGGGGGGGPDPYELQRQAMEKLEDFVRSALPSIVSQVLETFDRIDDNLREAAMAGFDLAEAIRAGAAHMENLRNQILGITTDLADRLRAAIEFNLGPGSAGLRFPGGGPVGGGGPFGGGGGDLGFQGPGGGGFSALSAAAQTATESVNAAGVAMIDLAALADQLTQEFLGVDFSFMSVQATADELRAAIEELGLTERETARLIQQVTEAERLRMSELRAGALGQLADMLERAGINSVEAARLRAEVEQRIFQIELKKLELQLKALEIWDKTTRRLIADLTKWAGDIGNFFVNTSALLQQTLPPLRGFGGGGGRRQKRKDLLEELNRLMSGQGGFTFADRLRQLNEQFEELRNRARKLRVPLEKVNQAYRVQLRILREQALGPLRDFRQELLSGPLSPQTLEQRFFSARSEFFRLARRAQAGDLDAINQLAGAGRAYLDLARQMFGSTARYNEIFNEVVNLVNSVLGIGGLSDQQTERHNQLVQQFQQQNALSTELHQEEQSERRRLRRAVGDTNAELGRIRGVLDRIEAGG